jgi:hypothetical protein
MKRNLCFLSFFNFSSIYNKGLSACKCYLICFLCTSAFIHQSLAQCSSVPAVELIKNGHFENGYTGFMVGGEYVKYNPSPGANSFSGSYYVGSDPLLFNQGFAKIGDHTYGATDTKKGNMLMIDGGNDPAVCWQSEEMQVQQNQTYYFSAWVTSLYNDYFAVLQFGIKGEQDSIFFNLGLPFRAPEVGTGVDGEQRPRGWTQIYMSWNSGNNTKATVRILNKFINPYNYGGNDFALDDISFTSSCWIASGIAPVHLTQSGDICAESGVVLNSGISEAHYLWKRIGTGVDTSFKAGTNMLKVVEAGRYMVCIEKNSCFASDTIEVIPCTITCLPAIAIQAPAGPFVKGTSITLHAIATEAGADHKLAWLMNNDTIPGQTSGSYTTTAWKDGDEIKVVLTPDPDCGTAPVTSNSYIFKEDVTTDITTENLLLADRIKLYPVPARNVLNVLFYTTVAGSRELMLCNAEGQQLLSQHCDAVTGLNDVSLPLTEIPGGFYLLHIRNKEAVTKSMKVMIE